MKAWAVVGYATCDEPQEAADSSCLKSSNIPQTFPLFGVQPDTATGAGSADPPKQHNGGFTGTTPRESQHGAEPQQQQEAGSTNISSKVSQAVQKRG